MHVLYVGTNVRNPCYLSKWCLLMCVMVGQGVLTASLLSALLVSRISLSLNEKREWTCCKSLVQKTD